MTSVLERRRRRRSKDILFYRMYPYSTICNSKVCIFSYGFSSSRSTFFFAIFLLFPRGRDFLSLSLSLSVFVTFCLLSSRRRQHHPKASSRDSRTAGDSLPFSFLVLSSTSRARRGDRRRRIRRDIEIMVDEQRTTDNDRENAEGDDDGATAPVPEKVTLLLKHHRFSAFDKTKRESRVCFRRRPKSREREREFCVFLRETECRLKSDLTRSRTFVGFFSSSGKTNAQHRRKWAGHPRTSSKGNSGKAGSGKCTSGAARRRPRRKARTTTSAPGQTKSP